MRAKENFSLAFWTLVSLNREPWSRIQLPDARSHHIVPSCEECAKDMLDIWKVN